jgi:hypothetical protein
LLLVEEKKVPNKQGIPSWAEELHTRLTFRSCEFEVESIIFRGRTSVAGMIAWKQMLKLPVRFQTTLPLYNDNKNVDFQSPWFPLVRPTLPHTFRQLGLFGCGFFKFE